MNALDRYLAEKKSPEFAKQREEFIDFFRHYVNIFLDHIESWLREYIERGDIRIKRWRDIFTLKDEKIGEFKVQGLELWIGDKKVSVHAELTDINGARARIDMRYDGEKQMFLLMDKSIKNVIDQSLISENDGHENNEDLVWKLVTRDEKGSFITLDEEVFINSLVALIDDSVD